MGLQLACALQLSPLEIETDSTDVLLGLEHGYPTYNLIICECRRLMHQMEQVVVRHTFRQANQVSHGLAKEASKQSKLNQVTNFAVPPYFVENQFLAYKGGTHFVRFISDNIYTKLVKLGNQNVLSGISMTYNMIGSQ